MKIVAEIPRNELELIIKAELERLLGLDNFKSPIFEFSNNYSWERLPETLSVTIVDASDEEDAPL